MSFASFFKTVQLDAQTAAAILAKADFYVQQVESVMVATSGPAKLAAVKEAVLADLQASAPNMAAQFDAVWPSVNAVINGLVALYNAIGLFNKPAA